MDIGWKMEGACFMSLVGSVGTWDIAMLVLMLWRVVREILVVTVCPFDNYAKPTAHLTFRFCESCDYRAGGGKMRWATFGPTVVKI